MVYSYDLTFQDYLSAQKLCVRRNLRARIIFFIWYRIMPILGIAAVGLFVRDTVFHHFSYRPALGGALAGIAWIGLYPIICRPFMLRKLFKQLRPDVKGDHPIELEINGDDLISRIPGRSEGRFKQAAISEFVENDKIALLFITKKKFLFIPKTAMDDSGWSELRTWLGPIANRTKNAN